MCIYRERDSKTFIATHTPQANTGGSVNWHTTLNHKCEIVHHVFLSVSDAGLLN